MKYLVVSDIHGSRYYAEKLEKIIEKECSDKIILLGDLYYHGPRNPLPRDYEPKEVAEILNKYKDEILAVRGNCDAEVDQMISEFNMEENIRLEIDGKEFFFTHGHKYNIDFWPNEEFDVLMYGHFHTGFITAKDGKLFASPGSITCPKNNTKNSYLMIDNDNIILKDIDGNKIDEVNVKN